MAAEGRPVPVSTLIDQIWGDRPPSRVEASLQSYVARLRRALEPGRDARAVAQRLRTHAGGYSLEVADDAVEITATARTADRTGVEMEALTAVTVAGLTMIDMVKAVDPRASITDVRLLRKSGGKSGLWTR